MSNTQIAVSVNGIDLRDLTWAAAEAIVRSAVKSGHVATLGWNVNRANWGESTFSDDSTIDARLASVCGHIAYYEAIDRPSLASELVRALS